jgi:cyclopropane fatty-acyl-phospholipid synthase-like methyltransferase
MFNAPMSRQRAEYLIEALELSQSNHVVDIGCGGGAFLRLLASQYPVTGIGIDNNEALILQANEQWASQTNDNDVQYICSDAAQYLQEMSPVDTIICVGAEYIFGGYIELLQQAKAKLKSDGRILVGTIYWKQTPHADYLALMDGQNPNFDLLTTVQLAHDAGFIPLEVHRSNNDEWDTFESQSKRKRYLDSLQSNQPDMRERAWQWQKGYLEWGMDTMGFCFLILQKS